MTDRTTELLRKLLDERGVEYEAYRDIKNRCITKWRTYHGAFVFFAVEEEGKLFVETASDTEHSAICTPEQAIAATLGDEAPKKCSTCQYRYVVGQRPYPTFGYMCGFGDGKKLCGRDTSVLDHMGCEHWEKEMR